MGQSIEMEVADPAVWGSNKEAGKNDYKECFSYSLYDPVAITQ
jgi:hypothetical protein